MRILAIETSGDAGSVALLDHGQILARGLPQGKRTAQMLAPTLGELLAEAGRTWKEIDLLAVSVGPGSFTGLRIGVTMAKTLAYSLGLPVLGIDTHDLLAAQAPRDINALAAIIDAQRGDVFLAEYARSGDGTLVRQGPTRIAPIARLADELPDGIPVTGPGVSKLPAPELDRLRPVAAELRLPQAAALAELALDEYERGRRDDLLALAPVYLRASAAEEKWASKRA